jgi:curved DNA-binding protein CbpA
MINEQDPSYYDLLELTPDASPQEIRAAYLRAKAAFKKDSVALYTLISENETEDLLKRIEEAYQILSNPEKRREYDRSHGLLIVDEVNVAKPSATKGAKVVSIDLVPPMDDSRSESDLLVAPQTDYSAPMQQGPSPASGPGIFDTGDTSPAQAASSNEPASNDMFSISSPAAPTTPKAIPLRHPSDQFNDQAVAQEIVQEVEWRGPFLRKVREARNIPVEELSDYTKISKTYILSIEEEAFGRLPAAVYLRGFLIQIAKYLRLPHEKVAAAYMVRFNQALAVKDKVKAR